MCRHTLKRNRSTAPCWPTSQHGTVQCIAFLTEDYVGQSKRNLLQRIARFAVSTQGWQRELKLLRRSVGYYVLTGYIKTVAYQCNHTIDCARAKDFHGLSYRVIETRQ